MIKVTKTVCTYMIILFILAGCNPATPALQSEPTGTKAVFTLTPNPTTTATTTPEPTETTTPEPVATATKLPELTLTIEPSPTVVQQQWTADGTILPDEYTYQDEFPGLRFYWRNDDTYLYFAMAGDTSGWVAVGFDPDNRMQGANFIFGYITDGDIHLWDAYGTAPTGPNHPPDDELGGTVDIIAFSGLEMNGVTTFEIQMPLASGDVYDKALEPGQTYPYIIAMGAEDSFNARHIKYAGGQLALDG
jgi:hypothetical protein